MSAKFNFYLRSDDRRFNLPARLILGLDPGEDKAHLVLRLMAFLLFRRERMLVRTALHNDDIPFVPDLAELNFQLHPVLWVECGECSAAKLDKLAVKVPEAEIWVVRRSVAEVEALMLSMRKGELRKDRYGLLAFDDGLVEEVLGLMQSRNEVFWMRGAFDPPEMQFDFNGLWFDQGFRVFRF
jgi:hypothetical protein